MAPAAANPAHTEPSMPGRVPPVIVAIAGALGADPADTRGRVMEHRRA